MSTWGDIPSSSGRIPHIESFQEWLDEDIEPVPPEDVPPDDD